MSLLNCGRSVAFSSVLLLACFPAAPLAAQPGPQTTPQASVPTQPSVPEQPRFLQLDHRSADTANPEIRAILHSKERAIATEAAFFGYNLHASGWTWNETACPVFPDHLLLHYQRTSPDGSVSLFTALVPRDKDRVYVVPVLYRNATPFQSAYGSERSIAVFNRAVPAEVAEKALQPDGSWLMMGLCYAEMVGAESHALERSGGDVALSLAPLPTLHIIVDASTRQVIFTDRNAPGQYLVWALNFANSGRLLAANVTKLSDYTAPLRKGSEPPVRPLPPGQEPRVKVLPPSEEPRVKPRPH